MSTELGRLHVLVDTVELTRAALTGGAPVVQVRIKGVTDRELYERATAIVALCREAGATCIVNDRVDVALAAGADGVHLGADDLPIDAVRRVAGRALLVGGTARDPATALALVSAGADYLGVGPCYPTASKAGLPAPGGADRVRAVTDVVDVPVIAIAGVTPARVPKLLAAGAWGVAVIGAVRDAPDPASATRELVDAVQRVRT